MASKSLKKKQNETEESNGVCIAVSIRVSSTRQAVERMVWKLKETTFERELNIEKHLTDGWSRARTTTSMPGEVRKIKTAPNSNGSKPMSWQEKLTLSS
ncbi:hypothetical protein Pan161_18040 [Gimesia algae]|uniref:Uncharacterized protein n=1 Tax=Gimesia algae TaxID=2527971 RepID=A0A517VAX1_9PLAN|nr:hypothetical protein [Gimesia algae]QDT90154.1 hypothetical protein Pan161_18040 [Gimesia algae]